MIKQPSFIKPSDSNSHIHYTNDENEIWTLLLQKQIPILNTRACEEYLYGLSLLNLPTNRIPQLHELNQIVQKNTSWVLVPVSSLLSANDFFHLLANKQFPVATFIRSRDNLDYIDQPDIFHEVIGHCPMLMQPAYADFMQAYGQLALKANEKARKWLDRLFFFTAEIGLIQTSQGIKIYGGGILSSPKESLYALESIIPERKPFNINEIVEMEYGLDKMQKTYYIIENFDTLYTLVNDIPDICRKLESRVSGEHASN